ncbi:Putative lysophospholipase [Klebsiella pneumoniae]|nr:Putative lysophospholipase [Klebsiella pneumoniae]
MRDYSTINVEQGRLQIKERFLEDKIRFEEGNAFDSADLAAVTPKPTLGVVSGLYELFPENHLLRDSLAGLAQCISRQTPLITIILMKMRLFAHLLFYRE